MEQYIWNILVKKTFIYFSYQIKIKALSKSIKDVSMSPKIKAAYWIEHAVKHRDAPQYSLGLSQHHDLAEPLTMASTTRIFIIIVILNLILIALAFILYVKCYRIEAKPKLF